MGQPFSLGTLISVMTNKYVVGGFVLYGLGAVIWLGVLSKWDVSKAYNPPVGLGFVFTVLVGLMLGEQVSALRARRRGLDLHRGFFGGAVLNTLHRVPMPHGCRAGTSAT